MHRLQMATSSMGKSRAGEARFHSHRQVYRQQLRQQFRQQLSATSNNQRHSSTHHPQLSTMSQGLSSATTASAQYATRTMHAAAAMAGESNAQHFRRRTPEA
jgi:hypothetical protein